MKNPCQPFNQADVFVHATEEGEESRVEGERQVARLVDEVVGGQHHRTDEHIAVNLQPT